MTKTISSELSQEADWLDWSQLGRYCQRVADDALIEEIGRRLAEATPARSRIVLFGSRARREEHARSDVDVLVIEPSVDDPIQESVRLRRVLRGLGVPIDVLVVAKPKQPAVLPFAERSWSELSGRDGSSLTAE